MYTVVVHDQLNGLSADVLHTGQQKSEALLLANRIEQAMDNTLCNDDLAYDGEEFDS